MKSIFRRMSSSASSTSESKSTLLIRRNDKPLVGVCGPDHGGFWAWHATKLALWRVGCRAARLKPAEFNSLEPDVLEKKLQHYDGLVIGGGADVSPLRYGEEENDDPSHAASHVRLATRFRKFFGLKMHDERTDALARDKFESAAIRIALEHEIPTIGICRGYQLIAVELAGAKLHRDLNPFYKAIEMINPYAPYPCKDAQFDPSSRLFETLHIDPKAPFKRINALHLRGVDASTLDSRWRVVARDDAGVPQAIEPTLRNDKLNRVIVAATQWHPEYMSFFERRPRIFEALKAQIDANHDQNKSN